VFGTTRLMPEADEENDNDPRSYSDFTKQDCNCHATCLVFL